MEIKLKRVHAGKDLAVSCSLAAAGAACMFLNRPLGAFLILCGLMTLLFYKSGYKREGTGILLEKKSLNLCRSCRSSIVLFLAGEDVDPEIKEGTEGGSILLQVYFSRKAGVAYAQLFDFREVSFEEATHLVELSQSSSRKLIALL